MNRRGDFSKIIEPHIDMVLVVKHGVDARKFRARQHTDANADYADNDDYQKYRKNDLPSLFH